MCAKFQLDRSIHLQVMTKFEVCKKTNKKNFFEILLACTVSWDWLVRFALNLVCRLAHFGSILAANYVEFR